MSDREIMWRFPTFTCYGCKKKRNALKHDPIKMRNARTNRMVSICEDCAKKNEQAAK